MRVTIPEAVSEGQGLLAWDPMIEQIRQQILNEAKPPVTRKRRSRLAVLWLRVVLRLGHRRWHWVMGALTTACAGSAALIVALSWPIVGSESASTEVVAAAATATAFASVVFSALVLPQQAAASLAPGFSSETSARALPWIVAITQVAVTASLFTLAALGPDTLAAIAAGLLAAALFGFAWMASFQLAASSDAMTVAERQARYLRERTMEAIVHLRRGRALWVSKDERDVFLASPWSQSQDLGTLTGMLRHTGAGISAALSKNQPLVAWYFWEAQVDAFTDYAQLTNGRVGGDSAAVAALEETLIEFVGAAMREGGETDRTAQRCVRKLEDLACLPYDDNEFSAVRGRIVVMITRVIERTWNDDQSTLPADACSGLTRVAERLVRIGGMTDVERILERLEAVIVHAQEDRRLHIEQAGGQAVVDLLPALMAADNPHSVPVGLVRRWGAVARTVAGQWLSPPRLFSPEDLVVPGTSLNGIGIQQRLWTAEFDPLKVQALAEQFSALAVECIERCAQQEHKGLPKWDEPLVPLFGLALRLCASESTPELRQQWAAELTSALTQITSRDYRDEIATDGGGSTMLWSATVAVAFLGSDPLVVRSVLGFIAERPPPDSIISGTARNLDVAVRLICGTEPQPFASDDSWHGFSDHFDFPPNGRAPAVNRNRVNAHPELLTHLDQWVLETFPALVGVPN